MIGPSCIEPNPAGSEVLLKRVEAAQRVGARDQNATNGMPDLNSPGVWPVAHRIALASCG
jgi:hypothetical protein